MGLKTKFMRNDGVPSPRSLSRTTAVECRSHRHFLRTMRRHSLELVRSFKWSQTTSGSLALARPRLRHAACSAACIAIPRDDRSGETIIASRL